MDDEDLVLVMQPFEVYSGVEGAERSGGLRKRGAEDWGASCRAPGTESLSRLNFLASA